MSAQLQKEPSLGGMQHDGLLFRKVASLPASPASEYIQKFVVQVQAVSDASMLWRHHLCSALDTCLAGLTAGAVCAGTDGSIEGRGHAPAKEDEANCRRG